MPAGYTDILFGKLALQHQIASPAQLHECLNALEAGQRAGVTQTLSQVLVKRGYLSRQQQRDLDDAVSTAEKGRRAKLVVQLLLRHGRPPEQTLKSYYESLKSHNFPLDLAQALEQYNQITAEERKGLDQAVQRAIPSLCQREAEELALQVEELRKLPPEEVAMRLAAGNTGAGSMSGPMPAAVARATAMRAAYNPDAAQAAQAQAAQAQAAQAQAQAQYAAQMQAAHMQYQAQVQYAAQMQAQAQYQAQYQHAQMQQVQLQQAAQLAAAAIMNPAAIMNNPAAAAALGEASQALLRATGMRAAYVPDASTVPAGLAGSPSDTIPAGAPLPEAAASSPGAAPDAKAVPATEARKEAPPPSQDAKTREGPAPGAALAAAEAAPAAPAPAGSSSPVAAPGAVSTPTNALKRAGGTSAGIVVPAGLGGPPGMPGVVDPAMAAAIAGATSQALARATGMRAAYPPDGSGAIPVGPMGMGVPPPPVRATGMRAAYVPGPDGNPIAVAVPDPSAVMPMGYPGAVPPPPVRATGMRAAYVPGPDGNPMAVAVPDPSVMPMPGMPYPGAPMPGWPAGVMPGSPYPPQPMDRRHSPPGGYQPLGPGSAHPPHPAWTGGRTQERSAYQIPGMQQSPVAPPPAYPPPPGAPPAAPPPAGQRPAQFGRTVERNVADMKNLPAWAKTGVRKIDPDAMKVPAADTVQKKAHLPEPQAAVPGFDIHERLGKGHVGVVYRATERDTGRIIALKILYPIFLKNPGLAERFKREVKTAVTIDHQNIRKIYGGGEAGGNLYLAMELLDGETMQDKIEKQSQLQEAEALRWVAQIARAMDFYNQKALLHKDVKPENIFITKDNRAALCDMGLSKRTYEDYSLNQQGTTLGSPWYVSPEQGLGNEELDIRSDVYSLGVTLFHCLTGRVPFMGGNAGVIISKHATEAIPDVKKLNANVSRGAVALLERMMAKKREDRHQTPKELMAEIAWLRSESGIAATPIVPLDPPTQEEKDAIVRAQPSFFRRVLRKVGLG